MPTYITLLTYTQQGVWNIKDGPALLDAAKKAFQSMGVELKGFYLVIGQYDAVVISEASDDAKLALATGSLGNVRTETLRAFTEDEFRKIIAALP